MSGGILGMMGNPYDEGGGLLGHLPELQNSHGGSVASGLLGGMYSGLTLPRDVYQGKVDLNTNAGADRVLDMAGVAGVGTRGLLAAAPGLVPEGAIGMFAGRAAKTADIPKLTLAQDLKNGGFTPKEIWEKTGWFEGADGKWRFEIDDSASKFRLLALDEAKLKKRDQIQESFAHDELYSAYPDVGAIPLKPEYANVGYNGMYYPDNERITLNASSIIGAKDKGKARNTTLHELQHGVQRREGFATGGNIESFADTMLSADAMNDARVMATIVQRGESPENAASAFLNMLGRDPDPAARELLRKMSPDDLLNAPATPREAYRRLAGEVEARNVQTRRDFTPEQRRERAPWETEDVPRDQQIIRGLL